MKRRVQACDFDSRQHDALREEDQNPNPGGNPPAPFFLLIIYLDIRMQYPESYHLFQIEFQDANGTRFF